MSTQIGIVAFGWIFCEIFAICKCLPTPWFTLSKVCASTNHSVYISFSKTNQFEKTLCAEGCSQAGLKSSRTKNLQPSIHELKPFKLAQLLVAW